MKKRTLLFDLETSAIKAYLWGAYEQNIIEEIEESKIISVAWKWLGEHAVYAMAQPDCKGYRKGILNDRQLVKDFAEVLNRADEVIAHNGRAFDAKTLNARLFMHGLPPPKPYRLIDTKKVATKYFRFARNKLDTIARLKGVGAKIDTGGFELWKRCEAGDEAAWKKMKQYNKHDVVLLEKIYLEMRPWLGSELININVMEETQKRCTACGSGRFVKDGKKYTRTGYRQQYRCLACKHVDMGAHVSMPTLIR